MKVWCQHWLFIAEITWEVGVLESETAEAQSRELIRRHGLSKRGSSILGGSGGLSSDVHDW